MMRTFKHFIVAVVAVCGLAFSGYAATINITTSTPSYSFDTQGQNSGDPNAALSGLFFNQEGGGNFNTGHYLASSVPGTGTLTYAVSVTGFSSLDVSENSGAFQGPGGSITGTYSIDNGPATIFDAVTTSSNDNVYHTSPILLPNTGTHSVSIVYTVVNDNSGNGQYGEQLFRSPTGGATPGTDSPFVIQGVPEPASLGILSLAGLSLVARRRRA
jgi:hypothetical protein